MDTFKKEKKDIRNAIKNSMEVQNVRPIIINVYTTLLSKLNLEGVNNLEEELESIIYSTETWVKLDSGIRNLEGSINDIAEVDKVFESYISYTSYFSKILFLLTLMAALIIPVFLFGDSIAWVLWLVALVQVSVCLCIIKWKASNASSKFDDYEDTYVTYVKG
jgi:ABC-type transport system involved in cytochrome bd biosynthesis fused ATPase/permease subunit